MSDIDKRIDHLSEIVANLTKAGPSSTDTRQVDDLMDRVEELQAELKGLASRKNGVGLSVVQSEIRKATNALPGIIVPAIKEKFVSVTNQMDDLKDVTKRQTEAQLHSMRQMAQKGLDGHELKARAAVSVLRSSIKGELS